MPKHKAINLSAIPRTEFGKGPARRLRRDGRVPVVVYGHGIEPMHLSVDRIEFTAIVRNHGSNAVVELDVEGENQLAMIKHLDQNVLTFNIDHIDLLAIKRGEKVEVEIPVTVVGEVASGAMLMQDADAVLVEADVLSIPEEFVLNVEGLDIGAQIMASDIELPEDVTLVSEPDTLIVNVVEPVEEDLPEPEGEEEGAEGEGTEGDKEDGEDSDGEE